MSGIQSNNIANLCSDLGFSGEIPGRESKVLTAAVRAFRTDFSTRGYQLPCFTSNSQEAQDFALAFCEENQRGENFWPQNSHSLWPVWLSDRSKIIKSLAHIFSLQAYYSYQKSRSGRDGLKSKQSPLETSQCQKKQMDESPSDLYSADIDRELSPQSRQYVTPVPPRGTKRRPAKKPDPFNVDNIVKPDIQTYIDEVESLEPMNDDQVLHGFNSIWLSIPGAPFPSSADIRVKTFMHAENFYDSDDPDGKVLVLVNQLIKGTQIESCDTRQYRILTQRVLDRISFLAKKLWDGSLIEHTKLGKPQKTEEFRAYWDNRQSYWKSSLTSGNQALQSKCNLDVYDMDTVPANVGLSTTSSAKAPSKVHRLKASRKVPESTPRRRMGDESEGLAYASPHPSKRHKGDLNHPSPGKLAARSPNGNQDCMSIDLTGDPLLEDQDNSRHFQFSKEAEPGEFSADGVKVSGDSSSGQALPKGIKTRARADDSSTATSKKQLLTPTSPTPTPTVGTLSSEPRNRSSAPTPSEASHQNGVPSPAARPTRQRLFLIIQKSDFKFDIRNPISSAQLRDSSVSEFFELYSQNSGVPLEALNSLKFWFTFARGKDTAVVHKGDEEAWRELRELATTLFPIERERHPDQVDFKIVVEIEDVIKVKNQDDEFWGA